MKIQLSKTDNWKTGIGFGIFLSTICSFLFLSRTEIVEILHSTRVAKGIVVDQPDCPGGYRMKASCRVKIINTESINVIPLPGSVCESLIIGDTLYLKYSSDQSKFYPDNYIYRQNEEREYVLSIIGFFSGLAIFLYCFLKVQKNKPLKKKAVA